MRLNRRNQALLQEAVRRAAKKNNKNRKKYKLLIEDSNGKFLRHGLSM